MRGRMRTSLPFATKPRLTPLAAAGLVLVMLLASAFHLSRGEVGALPVNLVLGGIAAFVAWGRSRKAPIRAREDV
jgi:putative oxidoreductase